MTNEDVKILRMISGNCNLEKVQRDMLKRIADREESPTFKMNEPEENEIEKIMERFKEVPLTAEPVEKVTESVITKFAFAVDNAIAGFIEERIREGYPWAREFVFNTNNIADAMRRQVPEKPETWMRGYECGACGMRMGDMMREMKYCPYCGQKIDWGEIK